MKKAEDVRSLGDAVEREGAALVGGRRSHLWLRIGACVANALQLNIRAPERPAAQAVVYDTGDLRTRRRRRGLGDRRRCDRQRGRENQELDGSAGRRVPASTSGGP